MNTKHCSITECGRDVYARKICKRHYDKWRKYGNPLVNMRLRGLCSVDACDGMHYSLGYCEVHYNRVRDTGRVDLRTTEEFFWAKVSKDGPVPASRPELGPCWEWSGTRTPNGYGQLRREGRARLAHRWLFERTVGAIPVGLELDHLCFNPPCVNPAHLEPVTHAENLRRRRRKAA